MSVDKQGVINAFGSSKNGKPTVTIDGQLYYLGRCNLSGAEVGDTISFQASAFGSQGNLWGLDKWGKVSKGNGSVVPLPPGMTPAQIAPRITGSLDEPTLRFISNCVGSAIQFGTITDPEQIEKWVSAARNALKAQS